MTETITSAEQCRASLVRKLAEIVTDIDHVEKRGHNTFHNYKYVKASDLANIIRDKLSAKNIYLLSDAQSIERYVRPGKVDKDDQFAVVVMVKYTFLDGDTGAELSFSMPGCGEDKGDKGVFKAITGSLKYALRNAFLVPDESDPENDGHEKEGSVSEKIVAAFRPLGVTVAMIEKKLGHTLANVSDEEADRLRAIYDDAKGGTPLAELFFDTPKPPAAVQPPPVDHTPAKGTDEPRPGERAAAFMEEANKRVDQQLEAEKVQNLDKPPAASTDDKKEINLNARLRDFQSLIGDGAKEKEAFKQYILTYSGCQSTKDVAKAKWVEVLKALDAAKGQGVESLKKLVGLNKT